MFKKHKVQCVILAGGQGRRLDGKGKYSQPLRNKSLLEHVYSRMLIQTDCVAVNFREEKFKENFGFFFTLESLKDFPLYLFDMIFFQFVFINYTF